jgi:hypothetical protein
VNFGNADVLKKFKDTIYKRTPGGCLTISPIPTKYKRSYLPGGTLTLTVGKWRSFIDGDILDPEQLGRWTGNSYRLSPDSKLHVMTAYRVCDSKAEYDTSLSTFNQQYIGLQNKGYTNPNPRQQIIDDLIIQIKKLTKSEKDYLMIGIDANADITIDKKGLQKLCKECDLVDMYESIHTEDNENFPTHINGSKRIDYILCTTNLLHHVQKVGYIPFHEGIDSDHRAVFCDIDECILQQDKNDSSKIMERLIGTNSTNNEGEKYIRELDGFCIYHKLYGKVDLLLDVITTTDHYCKNDIIAELNKLDELLTRGMLASEKHNCKRKTKKLWSPKLNESHMQVQFWNVVSKSFNQQINADDRINHILGRLSDDTIEKNSQQYRFFQ